MAESGTSSLSFVLLIQMPDVTVANTVKQKIACHVLGVDSGTWMFIVVWAETHGGVNRSRSSVPRIDFHWTDRQTTEQSKQSIAEHWALSKPLSRASLTTMGVEANDRLWAKARFIITGERWQRQTQTQKQKNTCCTEEDKWCNAWIERI